jgi:tryptophan-rich sensory protein
MGGRTLGLAGWAVLCYGAAAVGALASVRARGVYAELSRPDWAPPSEVFGPVWTVLYASMALAAWLVWRARGFAGARGALALFVLQLAVNALWTWLFFAWRLGAIAFVEIGLLLALIAATTIAFWRIRPLAGALLLPYLAWVLFAAALTWATWQRNPGVLG